MKHRSRSRTWFEPRPNAALMNALAYLNRWLMLQWRFRIEDVDFPAADRARLTSAVNPGTAAFLVPNHPEFGLDWMMDKEVSTLVAPRMASWAAHEIIAGAPWFWTRNNLVSNRGGRAAFDYSVEWALAGHGVLLHPEGMVRWTADVVHPLFAGAAEMAIETARRSSLRGGRPVYVAPIVWKYVHTADITRELLADMARIERALELPSGRGLDVVERFHALHENLLARQQLRFGFVTPAIRASGSAFHRPTDFFSRQDAFRCWLVDDLVGRYGVAHGDSVARTIHRLSKLISTPDDRARVREAERLGGFCRVAYNTPALTQEQIAESLKRIRFDLMRRGWRNQIRNLLPPPHGARTAHVRVGGPIRVEAESGVGVDDLLDATRRSMQASLDALNRELARRLVAAGRENPFYWFGAVPIGLMRNGGDAR